MDHKIKHILLLAPLFFVLACSEKPTETKEAEKAEVIPYKENTFAERYKTELTGDERFLESMINTALLPVEGRKSAAVMEIGGNKVIVVGDRGFLPQQSVSKLWVALTVADKISSGKGSYSDEIDVSLADVSVFHQPLARVVQAGPVRVSVAQLLNASLTQSDNMANEVLLRYAGGPQAVQKWLEKNTSGIRFGPGDRDMQTGISGLQWNIAFGDRQIFEAARSQVDPRIRTERYRLYVKSPIDGARTESLVRTLSSLRMNEFSGSPEILSFMARTMTGNARLTAGTPTGWKLMHKTGTGQVWNGRTAGFNDIGIMESPSGKSYAVAVMIGDSSTPEVVMQNAIANIARSIVTYDEKVNPVALPTNETPDAQ